MQVNKIIKLCHILVYASLNFNIYAYQFQCIILLNAEKIIKLCDSICMVSLGVVCWSLIFFNVLLRWTKISGR